MVPRTYFLHGKLLHYFGGRRNLRTRFNSKVPNFLGRFYVGRAVPGGDSLLDPGKTRHGLVVELGREDDVVFMVPTVQNGLLACRVEFKIQIATGLHNAMNVFAAAAITISLTTDECVCCCNNYSLFMILWSYFSVVLTDPGSVPPNWRPTVDEERDDVVPLTGSEFGSQILNLQQTASLADPANPRVRYCRKCNQLKPPRCHHCSVCGRCVLKMDHHCVWVVNCVGALNYKFFLLFLFYTFLETTLVTLSLLPQFIAFFSDGEIPGSPGTLATTFLAFVLNLAFAVSVLGFMIMHISLVSGNTTTIEAYEKKTTPKWRYDLGRRKNFEQVFGTDKKHWFIPSYSEEDLRKMPALQGLDYPSKPDLDAQEF